LKEPSHSYSHHHSSTGDAENNGKPLPHHDEEDEDDEENDVDIFPHCNNNSSSTDLMFAWYCSTLQPNQQRYKRKRNGEEEVMTTGWRVKLYQLNANGVLGRLRDGTDFHRLQA
jgi:hypothetical protein